MIIIKHIIDMTGAASISTSYIYPLLSLPQVYSSLEVYAVRGFDVRTRELVCLLGEVF